MVGISIILRERSGAQISMLEIQEDLAELTKKPRVKMVSLIILMWNVGDIKEVKNY